MRSGELKERNGYFYNQGCDGKKSKSGRIKTNGESFMSVATLAATSPMDIRSFHERMGRVYHQPIRVRSFTNKRFTVNFRVPLEQLRSIVPEDIELDEIRDTGYGMFGMCACDFWVSRLGLLPIPPVRNNDMLCRVSTKVRKGSKTYRAYYTLRSDSSSKFLGFFGRRFSHFRKRRSRFERIDDGTQYVLRCHAEDPLCRGELRAIMSSVNKQTPDTTTFSNVQEATDFVFNLDGSCGYSYERELLSFQKIDYPTWDMYFCHEFEYKFSLVDYMCESFGLDSEFDCVLFMQNTPQTWGSSRMYRNPA